MIMRLAGLVCLGVLQCAPLVAADCDERLCSKAKHHVFIKQSISIQLAQKMIAAASKKAEELGARQNIAIVDEGGALKAFSRMDGAHHLSISVAKNKAYTALLGMSTQEFFESTQKDPGLATGVSHLDRVITFGGGFPIIIDGQVVGGIGISGGSVDEDIQCAKAALSIVSH